MAKILLVDDSEIARNQVRFALEGSNHTFIEASNGAEGIEVVSKNKDVDLILCDVNMPEMDGITMCGQIKAIPEMSKIPILMLTTESTLDLKTRGKEIGVLGWITKPFNAEKLKATVAKILT